jgi:hypothetical protein
MTRWKNYVWMAAGISALGVICAFTAKPLLAQIRAALVQNVDEPGRTPYLSYVNPIDCSGTTCHFLFAPIPAGKRLVATNITGRVLLQTPGILSFVTIYFSGVEPLDIPSFLETGVVDGNNQIGINATTGLFVDGPDQPQLLLANTTGFNSSGTTIALSGYLVDCSSPGSCAPVVR